MAHRYNGTKNYSRMWISVEIFKIVWLRYIRNRSLLHKSFNCRINLKDIESKVIIRRSYSNIKLIEKEKEKEIKKKKYRDEGK